VEKTSFIRRFRKASKRRRFQRAGMKPWSKGYDEYKLHEIERVLHVPDFSVDKLPPGHGFRLDERIVEYPWLFSRLPPGPGILLDAGSILNFEILLDHPSIKSKSLHICTLAPEPDCFWQKGVSYLFGDLRRLPYRDGWFDWIVSLSTLEHVGMDNSLLYTGGTGGELRTGDHLLAVRELHRVLKPGGALYASVPFGKAKNLGWYQVFNQPMIESMIAAFQPAGQKTDYFHYHPEGWRNSSAAESAEATVYDIHHAKGYDPDFAAAARAVCCLELTK
jgi:hypothetical protein